VVCLRKNILGLNYVPERKLPERKPPEKAPRQKAAERGWCQKRISSWQLDLAVVENETGIGLSGICA
jgi:hypothetical protein